LRSGQLARVDRLFPYTPLFRSRPADPAGDRADLVAGAQCRGVPGVGAAGELAAVPCESPRATAARGGRPPRGGGATAAQARPPLDRKSTRLNSSHVAISYPVFW